MPLHYSGPVDQPAPEQADVEPETAEDDGDVTGADQSPAGGTDHADTGDGDED